MDLNIALKKFIDKNKNLCDFLAVRWIDETWSQYQYRNGKPLPTSQAFNTGIMIEIHYQGHISYFGTCHINELGLQSAFDKALTLAKANKKNAVTLFDSEKIRPPHIGKYASNNGFTKLDRLSLASIHSFLKKTNEKLKINSSEIINTHSYIFDIQYKQLYFSSLGAEIEQNTQKFGLGLTSTAQRGSEVQNRSYHGGLADCTQQPFSSINEEFYYAECEKISFESIELLSAENCPNGTMDLILMPDQMMLQIHESIGHPLELDRILGDERNYAGSSFVKLEDFGQLIYGSNKMNVTFDPTVESQLASYSYDDNGNKATREFLIKDGKLIRPLGGLESQFRTQFQGVANARSASWNRAPIDRMANINLEAGTSSMDDLIRSVQHGVIMYANKSWSIDDYRNKFQFGCEYAKLIENGRLTRTLKNPNYRGQTVPFWHNLKLVGNTSTLDTFGTFYCGKGEPSQIISVGHRSPACLFSSVEVFGGHT